MRIGLDKAVQIVELLCEGMSIAATARISKVAPNTVTDLLLLIGRRCEAFFERKFCDLCVDDIQADEVWNFVFCKNRTTKVQRYVGGCGDFYTFTALEKSTKLVLAWHFGRRNQENTYRFCEKLRRATRGPLNLSTDAFTGYPPAVDHYLGHRVTYGTLKKLFGEAPKEDRRKYSPARIIGIRKRQIIGLPDPRDICTSHCERLNASIRTHVKRMARLTYCFSKRKANHQAAMALYFCHYNLCRKHKALHGLTPAMAHGVEDHVWTVRELLENCHHG
jgi:IS1 family transposase